MNLTIQDNYQKIIPYKGKYYKIIPLIKKTITIIILCTLVIILLNKKINYFYLISLLPFIFILSYLLLKTKNKKEPSLRLLTISLKENELILEYPKTLVYDKQYNEVWQKEQYKCYYKDIKTINYSIEDKRIEIYGKFHIKKEIINDNNYLYEEVKNTVKGIYPYPSTITENIKKLLEKNCNVSINNYGKERGNNEN